MTTARPLLVAALSLTTACAGLGPQVGGAPIDPRLQVGSMGMRSGFELRNAPAEPRQAPAPKARRAVTPVLFWLGIGMVAVGGATAVGTGVAGYATKRRLADGFEDNISSEEVDTLSARGDALNSVMVAGTVIGVVGAALALITYGIDYTRCGPLAPKRRRDNAPPGRCAAEDRK
jgi:hypothetical protein